VKLLLIARPFVFHGGVERATYGLVEALVAHGHDVHLLTPGAATPVPGATVHRLALPPLPRFARLLWQAGAAARVAAAGAWDIVQSHERTLRQDVYRAGEGCHRAYLASRDAQGRLGAYHRTVLALERRVFARTPEIVAIAAAGKREIETLYGVPGERVSVVYNGVDLARFDPGRRARDGAAARAEAGVPAGAWTVLFVGSGFARKGLATALEALARLGDRESRLLVVGRGDVARHRRLAAALGVEGRVGWLGARPDVERWYAAADAVVLPTRYEPFGNVHLEALASGVPVVTSTAAGGAEIVREDCGAVVPPHDAAAVAGALERLRAAAPAALAAAARRAAEPFTYAAQVAGFARVWARRRAAAGANSR
jgi:UDP-glucose:(heptosyl)LPS alpha-1,3-glucosyltransferase